MLPPAFRGPDAGWPVCDEKTLTGPAGRSVGDIGLPGLDADRQAVLLRRQRTGRELGEGAGRVLGAVEVEDDAAVAGEVGVEEPAAAVGLLLAGGVGEDEEQARGVGRLEDGVE